MKKLKILIVFLLISLSIQSQDLVYGNDYSKIRGERILGWTVSVDNTNRCNNNFSMFNYSDADYKVTYKLYLDSMVVYVGWTPVYAGEGLYWNNAFVMCNPQKKKFKVDATLEKVKLLDPPNRPFIYYKPKN